MIFNYDYCRGLFGINEVYFGKNRNILAIEQQLSKYRKKYMGNYINKLESYSDSDLRKLEKMLADYFGMEVFDIVIHNQPTVNASTIPIGIKLDVINSKKMVISTREGFKFKKEAHYACIINIYSGIIFNDRYTDEEVLAIILHEIGHNFQHVLNDQVGYLTLYHKILLIPSLFIMIITRPDIQKAVETVMSTTQFSNTISLFNKRITTALIDNNPIFKFGSNLCSMVSDFISSLNIEAGSIPSIFTLGLFNVAMATYTTVTKIYSLLMSPLALIMLPIEAKNKMGENIADNFATMYGYGPALSSALEKMSVSKADVRKVIGAVKKIPVVGSIYQMNEDISMMMLATFDEHQHCVQRANAQIRILETELGKSDLNPETKKRIKSDIDQIKKDLKQYLNSSDDANDFINKAYGAYLAENVDGNLYTYVISKFGLNINTNNSARENQEKDMYNQYDVVFQKNYRQFRR